MMEGGRIRNSRVSSGMLPLLALHAVTEYWRLDRKPPVTAGLIAANTLVYLRPAFIDRHLPTIDQVWFNPYLIVKHRDMKRFVLSAFYHLNDPHLVYNMLSLLWKGIQLETSMGSYDFATMVVSLLGLSQGTTLLLAKSLYLFFGYEKAYYQEYAVGFSGVLFAMKVVLNSQSDNYTNVHGLMVPARHAAWAELILIQMFVPGTSFLGHLGGILAGIFYVKLKASYSGSDPLAAIFRGFTGLLSWPLRFVTGFFTLRRRRITGRGTVGRGQSTSGVWRCQACTFDNSGWLSVCEMCGTSRGGGDGLLFFGSSNETQSHDLSLEELRRRRVQRFSSR